jgi:predicted GH43/DUF377 family glycosyl hydrolase
MWYTHFAPTLQIGYASSKDGIHWTKHPTPVLSSGAIGTWDQGGAESPSVIWNGTYYLMYYIGSNGTFVSDVGVAFSRDMVNWQKYSGNPVLTRTPNSFDGYFIKFPAVLFNSNSYEMWYTAQRTAGPNDTVGYASSTDGLHWTKYNGNPVITTATSSKGIYAAVRYPYVVRNGSAYLMVVLLTNLSDDMSYATSNDGTHWKFSSTILLTNSNSTRDWDFILSAPTIIPTGRTAMLWYSGRNNSIPPYPSIGLAYCPLVILPSAPTTVTTSVTVTSTRIQPTTVTTTATATTTVTTALATGPVPTYDVSTVVLGGVLAVALAALLLSRRKPI